MSTAVLTPATAPPPPGTAGSTPIGPASARAAHALSPMSLRRFTVAEYHRMIRDGYFGADERCELIRGLIVHQMPRDPIHDAVLEIVLELLRERMPAGWRVRPQMAVTTPDSEPEPDAAVVRGRPQDYFASHPTPADMALAVEVSNTTVSSDRGTKGPLYAESKVPVYWIVNLPDRRVEVYTDPTGPDSDPAYRRRQDYAEGSVIPLSIGGVDVAPIAVSDLLPPR